MRPALPRTTSPALAGVPGPSPPAPRRRGRRHAPTCEEDPEGREPAEKAPDADREEISPAPTTRPARRGGSGRQAVNADGELSAKRERLIERFAVMQADLGGLLYEMVIRDSVQMDVLKRKVADLQQVDSELGYIEHTIKADESGVAGNRP